MRRGVPQGNMIPPAQPFMSGASFITAHIIVQWHGADTWEWFVSVSCCLHFNPANTNNLKHLLIRMLHTQGLTLSIEPQALPNSTAPLHPYWGWSTQWHPEIPALDHVCDKHYMGGLHFTCWSPINIHSILHRPFHMNCSVPRQWGVKNNSTKLALICTISN